MREERFIYVFKIAGFTPETMPFGRLVDYYAKISKVLGAPEAMHLIDITESSHGSRFAIDPQAGAAVNERLALVASGRAPRLVMRTHDEINAMLREDETSGYISDVHGDNVLVFPGKATEETAPIRLRDTATFTGELYHIAAAKDDVKIRISTEVYGVVFCVTTKDVARGLRDFLFETVRVSGRGLWIRSPDGTWSIQDFTITDFAPVKIESLRNAVNRVRSLAVGWPDNLIEVLDDLDERHGTGR